MRKHAPARQGWQRERIQLPLSQKPARQCGSPPLESRRQDLQCFLDQERVGVESKHGALHEDGSASGWKIGWKIGWKHAPHRDRRGVVFGKIRGLSLRFPSLRLWSCADSVPGLLLSRSLGFESRRTSTGELRSPLFPGQRAHHRGCRQASQVRSH